MNAADSSLSVSLEALQTVLREAGDETSAAQTRDLIRKLRDEQLQIVVMGEFKRGKSSLINALVGKAVLPVASVPLTAVVTVVQAGERDGAEVEFLDGRRRDIEISAIEDYVSEERNHKNHRQVDRVVVRTPSPFLSDGTWIVDTPGAGSVYRHNTEVAQKYVPHCDAVILVLSIDPPISGSEVEFLHSIRRWAKKLFVLQNKIDYLSGSDLDRSLAFTREVLRDALGDSSANIFPVSAKLALEAERNGDPKLLEKSGFRALTGALRKMLDLEKRTVVRASVASKARRLLDHALIDVELALGALRAGAESWDEKVRGLERALAEAKRKQYEFSKLYQAELKDHVAAMEKTLYARVRAEAARIVRELEQLYAAVKSKPAAQAREELNRAFLDAVESAFTRFLADEEPKWTEQFRAMTDRYLSSTAELVNAVLSDAAAVLGVPHRPLSKPAVAVAAPSVWFVLEEVSIWSGGILSTPTLRVFKPFFWRAMRRKAVESMDVNAGRLRYDYSRRLERSGEEALAAIAGFFDPSIAVLEKAAAKAADRGTGARESADAELARLEERRDRLTALLEGFPS